jgi:hypothetical protein
LYPYRIRITDPIEINIFKQVSSIRFAKITPSQAKRIGHKIPRKIKRDGILIKDGIFTIYNPKLKLDYQLAYGKRKGYDFIIKNIF